MSTLEMQKLMELICANAPKENRLRAFVLLTIPMGEDNRDAQWIFNCRPGDGEQLVIDTGQIFSAGRS